MRQKKRMIAIIAIIFMMFASAVALFSCGSTVDEISGLDNDSSSDVEELRIEISDFSELKNAIRDNDQSVLVLINNIDADTFVEISSDKSIVLELNGKTITYTPDGVGGRLFVNHGTFTIKGEGTVMTPSDNAYGFGTVNNYGKLYVFGGTYTSSVAANANNFFNRSGGEAHFQNVIINGQSGCISAADNTLTYINGGKYVGYKFPTIENNGHMEITAGEFINYSCNKCTSDWGYAVRSGKLSDTAYLKILGESDDSVKVTGIQGGLAVVGGTSDVHNGVYKTEKCQHHPNDGTAFYAGYFTGESYETSTTIYGGTFESAIRTAVLVGNKNPAPDSGNGENSTVMIYGGTFTGGDEGKTAITVQNEQYAKGAAWIEGGIFSSDIHSFVPSYCSCVNSGSDWVVSGLSSGAVEVVDGDIKRYYPTLEDAFFWTHAGSIISLNEDLTVSKTIDIGGMVIEPVPEIWFDAKGHSISYTGGGALFNVSNVCLIISGNGEFRYSGDGNDESEGSIFSVHECPNLILENGTYVGKTSCIGGTGSASYVAIVDGNYSVLQGNKILGVDSENSGSIVVFGGSFKNFDPVDPQDNHCDPGFWSSSEIVDGNTIYTVHAPEAYIGDIPYKTLQEAINVANGNTIHLKSDINSNIEIPAGEFSIELNGFMIGGIVSVTGSVSFIKDDSVSKINSVILIDSNSVVKANSGVIMDCTAGLGYSVEQSGTDEITYETVAIEYVITFHDGDNSDNRTFSVTTVMKPSLDVFTKIGYKLTGWATNPGGESVYDGSNDLGYDGSVTDLYAVWVVLEFTITFDTDGGTAIEPKRITYGATIEVLASPTKDGYDFKGWEPTLPETMPAEDLTVKAIWSLKQYLIDFKSNQGEGQMEAQKYKHGENVVLSPNGFSRIGYIFNGWNTAEDGNGVSYGNEATLTGIDNDLTLYAQWTANKYKIEFDVNGGSGTMDPVDMVYDIPKTLIDSTIVFDGYTFLGWSLGAEDSNIVCVDGGTVNNLTSENGKTVTLYAQWAVTTHTVSFNANGGTGTMVAQSVEHGKSITFPSNSFTRSGYTFNGWNTQADGKGTAYAAEYTIESVTGDVTLYAQWTQNYVPPSSGGGNGGTTTPPKDDTVVDKNPDGSSTETKTENKTNSDGSKTETITVTEKDKDGNTTGTSKTETTTSTKKENGSTITTESSTTMKKDADGNVTGSTESSTVKTESSNSTTIIEKEEIKDADDNVTSSTEKITETVKIDGGTLVSEKTEVTDATGNVTTTENIKAESNDGVVKTTVESDDAATTVSTVITTSGKVDDKVIEMAIAQSDAVSDKVSEDDHSKVIQIDIGSDSATAEVSLSPESLSAIAEKGAEFKVICKTGTMQLDKDVIGTLTDPKKDVTVTMYEPTDNDLTEAQVSAKGDRFGVSMQAVVGEDRYHMLGGKVTVTIPYDIEMGSNYGIFYIDEQGVRTFMNSVYDEIMKAFVFETDHFSLFVVDEVPAPVEDSDDNTFLYIGIVVGTIVIIAIATVFLRKH